jgi:DNA-binding CsgD family transcriptional regulator
LVATGGFAGIEDGRVLTEGVQRMQFLGEGGSKLGPMARLTLLAALIGFLSAGAVAAWIESRVEELVLRHVVARANDQLQLGIMAVVRRDDFELPYSPDKQTSLATRLEPLLARIRDSDADIIRLNLFARDGTILYSDAARLRGQTVSPLADEPLARALGGTAAIQVSTLDGSEDSDLRLTYGRALEAYIPFMVDGEVLGVFEFDTDVAPIGPIRPLVWGSVGSGWMLVFTCVLIMAARTAPDPPRRATTQSSPLTRRELEVLRLMASDLTYPQIACRLVVDEETVRSHAKGVLRKLKQSSRADAVLAARRLGILQTSETSRAA